MLPFSNHKKGERRNVPTPRPSNVRGRRKEGKKPSFQLLRGGWGKRDRNLPSLLSSHREGGDVMLLHCDFTSSCYNATITNKFYRATMGHRPTNETPLGDKGVSSVVRSQIPLLWEIKCQFPVYGSNSEKLLGIFVVVLCLCCLRESGISPCDQFFLFLFSPINLHTYLKFPEEKCLGKGYWLLLYLLTTSSILPCTGGHQSPQRDSSSS